MASPGAAARVAVVIPCFNDGATLLATVRSLEGEEPHQVVVVDDGSTDAATLALLAELERGGCAGAASGERWCGGRADEWGACDGRSLCACAGQ